MSSVKFKQLDAEWLRLLSLRIPVGTHRGFKVHDAYLRRYNFFGGKLVLVQCYTDANGCFINECTHVY